MTLYERLDLNFIRNLSDQELRTWYEQASEDDIAYVMSILASWESELNAEFLAVAFMPQNATIH